LNTVIDMRSVDSRCWSQRILFGRFSWLHHPLSESIHLCFTVRSL